MQNNAQILIVDDDLALLQALPQTIYLRLKGIKVDTSDAALVALDRIQQTDYDAHRERHQDAWHGWTRTPDEDSRTASRDSGDIDHRPW
ncbi:MAG: hypothetical protein H0V70_14360 [Ktedonobacteraceae bacterium]|nr:hypothetical protein [Ktedonobacteraceae bacterium]